MGASLLAADGREGVVDDLYLGLLIMATFRALFSGAVVVASAHEGTRSEAANWAASYIGGSLVAAYCFGRLL